jgi:integrase
MRQRGPDTWQLRVYVGVDADTGRERWATTTVRGSRRRATSELKRFVEQVEAPRIRAGSLKDLLERWFAAASLGWAPTTTRETRSLIDCHLAPHLGHLQVGKLTTADIDDFYAHLLRRGGRNGKPLSPATVRRVHVVLHRALAKALRWEWIWLNPASNASPPSHVPPEIRPPTLGEVATLLEAVAATDPALHLFLVLAAMTGARRGELAALRWGDVDLEQGSLCFQRALVEGPAGPVLAPTKTRRSHRVALDRTALAIMSTHHERVEAINPEAILADRFVFSQREDATTPWLPNWVTKMFIARRTGASLPHFRLHDLRHFMATQMLEAGVPISVVSGRLAHARTSTTLNVYAHAVEGGDRAAAETLSQRLGAATRRPAIESLVFPRRASGRGEEGT